MDKNRMLVLNPKIQLHYQSPIFGSPNINGVIVREYHKEIAHRAESPLQAAVDVEVVGLGIVL
jgi:hypothetical protein